MCDAENDGFRFAVRVSKFGLYCFSARIFFILTQRLIAHITAMAFYNYDDAFIIVLGSSVVICTEYVTLACMGSGSGASTGPMSLYALLCTFSQN